jgi:hypothetical protein
VSKKIEKKPRGKYDDKLKVKEGTSFLDLVKSSVKDAKNKPKTDK